MKFAQIFQYAISRSTQGYFRELFLYNKKKRSIETQAKKAGTNYWYFNKIL